MSRIGVIPKSPQITVVRSSFQTLNSAAACNFGCSLISGEASRVLQSAPEMAKQTELGQFGRAGGFFAPLFRLFPSKGIWPPRFQGNPNKHFDGFHPNQNGN